MDNILKKTPFIDYSKVDQSVYELYEGDLDTVGLNRLFPNPQIGCINFGYWDELPIEIDLNARLQSQIRLYNEVFDRASLSKGMATLEVGCGRGHGVSFLRKAGIDAWGIDPVNKQVQISKQNHPLLSDHFLIGSADTMPFFPESFNRVLSVETAQHFPDFKSFADEAHRVLVCSGMLIITTFFFRTGASKLATLQIIPSGVSGIHHMIPIDSAKHILQIAGFKNILTYSIGSKTFPGFCQWAKQQSLENTTPHSSRWLEAYEKGLIDYFVITCKK